VHDERMIFASIKGSDEEYNNRITRKPFFLNIEFLSDVLLTGVMVAW
jgi:hypothetical protein